MSGMPACVFMPCSAWGRQMRASDSLELEFWTAVSCHVSGGNQTRILRTASVLNC